MFESLYDPDSHHVLQNHAATYVRNVHRNMYVNLGLDTLHTHPVFECTWLFKMWLYFYKTTMTRPSAIFSSAAARQYRAQFGGPYV